MIGRDIEALLDYAQRHDYEGIYDLYSQMGITQLAAPSP